VHISDIIKKIQNLPLSTRKIILWALIVIIGFGLISFYVKNFQAKIKNFKVGEFRLPDFQEEFKNFPEVKTPNYQ